MNTNTNENINPEYTGTWIPAFVMLDKDLSPTARQVYAEIASFVNFFGSNQWLAERTGVSEATIKRCIKQLKDKGFVVELGFDGRRRKLAASSNLATSQLKMSYQAGQNDPLLYKDKNKEEIIADVVADATPGQVATLPAQPPTISSVKKKEKDSAQKEKRSSAPEPNPETVKKKNEPAAPTVNALHYQVIKKYSLPIGNHNEVRAKSKRLVEEVGEPAAISYLQSLLDHDYRAVEGEFKPELNHSRDVYNKRIAIQKFIGSNMSPPVVVAGNIPEPAVKEDWGF